MVSSSNAHGMQLKHLNNYFNWGVKHNQVNSDLDAIFYTGNLNLSIKTHNNYDMYIAMHVLMFHKTFAVSYRGESD